MKSSNALNHSADASSVSIQPTNPATSLYKFGTTAFSMSWDWEKWFEENQSLNPHYHLRYESTNYDACRPHLPLTRD
jgi:hypothetical protein